MLIPIRLKILYNRILLDVDKECFSQSNDSYIYRDLNIKDETLLRETLLSGKILDHFLLNCIALDMDNFIENYLKKSLSGVITMDLVKEWSMEYTGIVNKKLWHFLFSPSWFGPNSKSSKEQTLGRLKFLIERKDKKECQAIWDKEKNKFIIKEDSPYLKHKRYTIKGEFCRYEP